MEPKEKEDLIKSLEESHVMIRKGKAFNFLGGFVATGIAIIGLSYASAKWAIETGTAATATKKIIGFRETVEAQAHQIDEILKDIPDAITRVEKGTCKSNREDLKYQGEAKERISTCLISFNPAFNELPTVVAGITKINTSEKDIEPGLRVEVKVEDVSVNSAKIRFRTWYHTGIHDVDATWAAMGL